jgi:ABC-type Fe3+-hydroxamate transport system substrate-binding protein
MNMSSPSDTIIDARGRGFTVQRNGRIVSLVPSITELLFDLGLDHGRIVGRTKFCIHPAESIRSVPVVGGTKDVHMQRLFSLHPDLVIANIDENMKETVEAIENDGHGTPVFVTHPCTIADALALIRDLGMLLDLSVPASMLLDSMHAALNAISGIHRGRALYLIWRRPWMAVSPGTYIDAMLTHVGYDNVIDEQWLAKRSFSSSGARRYPALTVNDIVELQPEVILFSSEPFPFARSHMDELLDALRAHGAALPDCRSVDGEAYSWYGSRITKLTHTLHG